MKRINNKQGQNLHPASVRVRNYEDALTFVSSRMVNAIDDHTEVDKAQERLRELREARFRRIMEDDKRNILARIYAQLAVLGILIIIVIAIFLFK